MKISPDGTFHVSSGHDITDITWHADCKVEGDPLRFFPNMNVCNPDWETEDKGFSTWEMALSLNSGKGMVALDRQYWSVLSEGFLVNSVWNRKQLYCYNFIFYVLRSTFRWKESAPYLVQSLALFPKAHHQLQNKKVWTSWVFGMGLVSEVMYGTPSVKKSHFLLGIDPRNYMINVLYSNTKLFK